MGKHYKLNTYLCDPAFLHCPVKRSFEHLGLVVRVVLSMVDAQVVPQLAHRHILGLVHGYAGILKGVLKLCSCLVGTVHQLESAAETLSCETLQLAILLSKLQSFPEI